jgi:hypothetical protein
VHEAAEIRGPGRPFRIYHINWAVRPEGEMKKSRSVAVFAVATIGLAIGCSSQDNQAVCVDSANRIALPEDCETRGSGGYFWYYHSVYARGGYPVIGSRVRSGGTVTPARTPAARGGFGSTARSHSVGA